MKKIIAAAFCVLLASSVLVQSCSKPDAVTTAPDPNPQVPVDSTKLSMPTTEPEIIQWAINKLSGEYLMTGREWYIKDVRIFTSGGAKATDTSGSHTLYGNYGLLTKEVKIGYNDYLISGGSFSMKYDSNAFYNRIFVNAAGDSFIAAQCGGASRFGDVGEYAIGTHNVHRHQENPLDVKASAFWDVSKFNNIKLDSGEYSMFYDPIPNHQNSSTKGAPLYQVQYFYKKDSLVIYRADYHNSAGGAITNSNNYFGDWVYSLGYQYGKKVK